jgi:hypothetical protein
MYAIWQPWKQDEVLNGRRKRSGLARVRNKIFEWPTQTQKKKFVVRFCGPGMRLLHRNLRIIRRTQKRTWTTFLGAQGKIIAGVCQLAD